MRFRLLQSLKKWDWKHFLAELFLITLGVLIALAIDSEHEKSDNRKEEVFYLQGLKESLQTDANELRRIIIEEQESFRACDTLYRHLRLRRSWSDSTAIWISNASNTHTFFPNRAVFENLKSLDFELIQNDNIRKSTFQIYEEQFESQKAAEDVLMRRVEERWVPLLDSKVLLVEDFQLEPVHYEEMLDNPRYMNYVALLIADHDRIAQNGRLTCMYIELLIREIDLELEKIKTGKRRRKQVQSVTIQLAGFQSAKQVVLAGTFNDWHHTKDTLQKTKDGWQITLALKPGVYMYKFIVDGEWMEDPGNPDKILSEYNNYNSILEVK